MNAHNDHEATGDSCSSPNTNEVKEGSRLTVYWSDDDQWYQGTAASAPREDNLVRINYDEGGSSEWVDLATYRWSSLVDDSPIKQAADEAMERKRERVQKLQVGSKVAVFWPHEKEFFTGTLTKIKDTDDLHIHYKLHRIVYADGDKEWTNLFHRKFKRVKPKALRLKVGSRIFLCKGMQNFGAIITKIKPGEARPHKIKYHKETRGEEWLNLYVHPFFEKPPRIKADPDLSSPTSIVLKKRKREFLQDMPESEIGMGWKLEKEKQDVPAARKKGPLSPISIKRDTEELERQTFELVRYLSTASRTRNMDKTVLASRILKCVDPKSEIIGTLVESFGDVKATPDDPSECSC
jgi:hypothetical protein